jgi:exosortase B
MAAVLPRGAGDAGTALAAIDRRPWLLVAAGWLLMYLPTYWAAAQGIWQSDDLGHGPIVLVVALWLFWNARTAIARASAQPAPAWAWAALALGLAMYLFGRVFTVSSVEFASQLFMAAALLLLLRGRAALAAAWFPVAYLVFMVPLPATLVDSITGPLKHWISWVVVDLLHAVGYPIARSGVTITVGQYQLLVADACSGLHSLISLAALGTLFMFVMNRSGRLHNAVMLASIMPVALLSNCVRVIVLVLVTYHFGDEAGQGFIHGAAGMILMLVALAFFFALDALLARVLPARPKAAAPDGAASTASCST